MPEKSGEKNQDVQRTRIGELETYRQVASDVSHDLNNLLLLISGYTELLVQNLDDRDQLLEIVQNIQKATSSVRGLSQKLQAMSHFKNDETESESVPDIEPDEFNVVRPCDVNILVFIFDGEVNQLVSRILEREGYGVGKIVVNKIGISTNRDSNESVDLIIADVDIFKVARVRARQLLRKYPNVPLLILTNEADEIPTIAASGGSSSLSRAFRPSELVAEVHRIFVQRNSRVPNSVKPL